MSSNTSNAPLMTEGASANRLPARERGTLSEVAGAIVNDLDHAERSVDALLGARFGNEQPIVSTDVYNLPGAAAVSTFVERPDEQMPMRLATVDEILDPALAHARYTGTPIEEQVAARETIDELAARRAEHAAREGITAAQFFVESGLDNPKDVESIEMIDPGYPNLALEGKTVDISGPDENLSYLRAIEYDDAGKQGAEPTAEPTRTTDQTAMANQARTSLAGIYDMKAAA